MALPKGLLIRSNGYYFQARIPKRYLSHYPKQTIYDRLPVETRQEAIKLVHERWAELHQQFALIDSSGSKLKQIPTGMEADHLIATAIHARMNADEEIRTEGVEDDSMHEQLVSWSNEADEAETTLNPPSLSINYFFRTTCYCHTNLHLLPLNYPRASDTFPRRFHY